MRLIMRAFSVLAVLLATGTRAAADKVELQALVVANSAYHPDSGLSPLKAAAIDGRQLLKALQQRQYKSLADAPLSVSTRGDFKTQWTRSLDALVDRMDKSGAERGFLTFYFSGHGTEVGNDSYLLPTHLKRDFAEAGPGETPNVADAHILTQGIQLRELFEEFTERATAVRAQSSRTIYGIFIIDACRTETLQQGEAELRRQQAASGQPQAPATPPAAPAATPINRSGLRPLSPPPGIFVLYAASAGQVAHAELKGDPKDSPSVYTRKLLELIDNNFGLSDIAQIVRWEVHQLIEREYPSKPQTPQYFDYVLSKGFTIAGGAPPPKDSDLDRQARERLAKPSPLHTRPADQRRPPIRKEVLECPHCPLVIVVPDGEFTMGSPRAEKGNNRSEEMAASENKDDFRLRGKFERRFAIGVAEVTVREFRAYLLARDKALECPTKTPSHPVCSDQLGIETPVTGVSWTETRAYLAWLNEQVGLKAGDTEHGFYRLPTDSEWEHAARGHNPGRFVSRDERELCDFGNGADQSLHNLTSNHQCSDRVGRMVAQVKTYKPNGFGLYDVHGNVWEWVADCWSEHLTADKADPAKGYMQGTLDAACRRVVRGGSWLSAPEAMRLAKRLAFEPDHKRPTIGFRVLRVLPR